MQLVDHDELKVGVNAPQIPVVIDELTFKRFGRDKEYASRPVSEMPFVGGADIAVPPMHRDFCVSAKILEPSELIVDKRLQWADVECLN